MPKALIGRISDRLHMRKATAEVNEVTNIFSVATLAVSFNLCSRLFDRKQAFLNVS